MAENRVRSNGTGFEHFRAQGTTVRVGTENKNVNRSRQTYNFLSKYTLWSAFDLLIFQLRLRYPSICH